MEHLIEQAIQKSTGQAYNGPVATPAAQKGGDTHHHHWHLNQSSTIADPDHFSAVVNRRVHGMGASIR
jgi:hypothetical protein